MTLSTSTASQTFPGNGVTQIFPCGFRIFQAADISVSLINATTGVSTPLVLNSDYTLTGEGNQTGFTLSTSVPVATGTNLLVARNIAYTQPTDFTNQGSFFPTMHEDCADRLGMQIQQLAGGIQRTLQLPDGIYPVASGTLPYPSPLAPLVWNAAGNGLANGSTSMTGDMLLRGNLASTAAGNGASLVGFLQAGAGAVARTVQDKGRDTVSVKDFGAKGDGVTDDTAAFLAAIAALETGTDYRGGTIRVPKGRYKLSSTLVFTSFDSITNYWIVGDGMLNTTLDFSGSAASIDGIQFIAGSQCGVRDLMLTGATGNGIVLNKDLLGYVSMVDLQNLRVQNCGASGIYSQNSYLVTMQNIISGGNASCGFNFVGNHTSIVANKIYAKGNTGTGIQINGAVYIDINAQSDGNQRGYAFSNIRGAVLRSPGSEGNLAEGMLIRSSDASAVGIAAEYQNIQGFTIIGAVAIRNNASGPLGVNPNSLSVISADSRPISITMIACVDNVTAGDNSLALAGTSGQITLTTVDCGFGGPTVKSGTTEIRNTSNMGRYALAVNSVDQAVVTATATTITLNSLSSNTLGATLTSNAIVIPAGVNSVRVSGGVTWAGSTTGQRYASIVKNGAGFNGLPCSRVTGTSSDQPQLVSSGVISVSAGDTFSLLCTHDVGSNLAVRGPSFSTFLRVEAVS